MLIIWKAITAFDKQKHLVNKEVDIDWGCDYLKQTLKSILQTLFV